MRPFTPDDDDDAPRGAQPLARLAMDGRPVRRRRRDASANRARILLAADELLRERGGDVHMEEVAAAAGVGKGTLYRNYPNRAALAHALLDDLARDLQSRALGEAARQAPALERLDAFMGMACAFVADNLDLLCIAQDDRREDARMSAPYRWQRMVLARLLAEAEAEAEGTGGRAAGDAAFLPDAMLALIEPGLVRHALRTVGLRREELVAVVRRAARGMAAGAWAVS